MKMITPFFLWKHIKKRIDYHKYKKIEPHNNHKNTQDYSRLPKIQIPYSHNFYKKYKGILKEFNIIQIPKIDKNCQNIVTLGKDKTNKFEKTGVIYKFQCKNCPSTYIGETKRALKIRLDEHKNLNRNTVVSRHMKDNKHEFDFEKTKILDTEKLYNKRLTSEMIYIYNNKNSINKKTDIKFLSSIYKPIIKTFKS